MGWRLEWRCPTCGCDINPDDVVASGTVICTSCGVRLRVDHEWRLAYVVVSLALGFLIAYLQGLQSIELAGAAIIYAGITIFVILRVAWPLKFPMRLDVAPGNIQTLNIQRFKK